MQALSFSSVPDAVCFSCKTSVTGMISSSLWGVLPHMNVLWLIKFLIYILIMKPGVADVIVKFQNSFERLWSLEDKAVALMAV